MMRRIILLSAFLYLVMVIAFLPKASAQNYGQIRALKLRASTVIQQKNHFVARVLSSYDIPYQLTEQGIVARLHIENRWYDVNQIEIVPVAREEQSGFKVVGHEIFFYTEGEILHLVSAVTIR